MAETEAETTPGAAPFTEPPEDSLCYRLAEARRARDWRQVDVAKRAGTSVHQVSRYESGKSVPGVGMVRRLCDALAVTPSWLIYGTDDPLVHGEPDRDVAREVCRATMALAALNADDRRAFLSLVRHMLELQRGADDARKLYELADMMAEQMAQSESLQAQMEATAEDVAEKAQRRWPEGD